MHLRFPALLLCACGLLGGCAEPPPSPPSAMLAEAPPEYGLPPSRRAAPAAPYSANRSLLAARVAEAIDRREKDRWERFVDAMDRGELAVDLRLKQDDIDEGKWPLDALFNNGDELFEHDFGAGEGFGRGPGRSRVHLGATGGPDALSCAECHHRGGFDGSGERGQNAFFDGDGFDRTSAFERNAPIALGLGFVQRLGEEMTAALTLQRNGAVNVAKETGLPVPIELAAKGIRFGRLVANGDGSLDTSAVVGVSPDLVVRPFGWKGSLPSLREFAIDGFQRHHGVQVESTTLPGKGPTWDRDDDGRPHEITEGMITSTVAYLSLLEIPVMIPPRDAELLRRHGQGGELFDTMGCAGCHVPSLPLHDTKLVLGKKLTADLVADGEQPQPRKDVYVDDGTNLRIFLFSDLKRHAMGSALSERRPANLGAGIPEIPGDVFLTRTLWGVADTGPWLHDGRARTLDEAILLHGGEAARARDAFAKATPAQRADVRLFLTSLTRYPRIEYR